MDCQSITTPTALTQHILHGGNVPHTQEWGQGATACEAKEERQTWLLPLQVSPRKCVPRRQTILGMCALSVAWTRKGPPHHAGPRLSRRELWPISVSCQWRVVLLRAVGHNPQSAVVNPIVSTDPNHGPSRSFAHGRLPPGTHARLHSRVGTHCRCASCTVVAKAVENAATPAICEWTEGGQCGFVGASTRRKAGGPTSSIWWGGNATKKGSTRRGQATPSTATTLHLN